MRTLDLPMSLLCERLDARLSDMMREREGLRSTLLSHNRVIRTSPGLYLRAETRVDGTRYARVVDVLTCSRWERADADRIVASADLRDGAGKSVGEVVFLGDALDADIVTLRDLCARMREG